MVSSTGRSGFAQMLADPEVRRAYVTTKVCVVGAAAVLTWPLSSVLGVRVWYGFAAFAALMLLVTVVVLAIGRSGEAGLPAAAPDDQDEDDEADPDPRVVLEIEDSIDLHSFPPAQVPEVVAEYLIAAHEKGYLEVRLVHGRGIGVQRERVRSLLARHPLVREFADAPPDRGGWGATVAWLVSQITGTSSDAGAEAVGVTSEATD